MRIVKCLVVMLLAVSILMPGHASAAGYLTARQNFLDKLAPELNRYIKTAGGTISLQYQDLVTGDYYVLRNTTAGKAASTIKLPLAIYVMELASKGKLDLEQKLTYKSHHYNGGSGVIQYDKVGTKYTIRDLVKKSMVHSDNIAFVMLRERVGKSNFIAYMKSLGAQYAYPNGQNMTSPRDLIIYAKKLYSFSKTSPLGKELDGYLRKTVYNTTIPKGIPGVPIAHKVGMIPNSLIYNDVAVVYDKTPYVLAIMTKNISYEKSQKVIAGIASIIHKHHKAKEAAGYMRTKVAVTVYLKASKDKAIGTLQKGANFKVKAIQGEWYVISYSKGTGYIERRLVTAAVSPGISSIYFTSKPLGGTVIKISQNATVLNRTGSGAPLGIMNKGQEVFTSGIKSGYYIIDIGGRVGYIQEQLAAEVQQ
ncbi:serine hydrolase [Bacillus sp. EB01]|uniref:serine hydrolase n=1 Tax=Bacillus sp. EB01 TaxID=1347086 RepID=UPI000694FA23|nr:serine hydrolase [Bacillus sp. EB01]